MLSISTTDESLASLQLLIADMTTQQNIVVSRIMELSAKARDAVSKKNKPSAIAALRSRKNHETLYKSRSDKLVQLEGVYLKLVEAVDQAELVKMMQESTHVLRDIHKNIGGVEAVEDVVEGLRAEMDRVDDINIVISENANTSIGDEDIDSELQELEMKQKEEDEQKRSIECQKTLQSLPPTPRHQEEAKSVSADEALEDSTVSITTNAIHWLSIENNQGDQVPESTRENTRVTQEAVAEPV